MLLIISGAIEVQCSRCEGCAVPLKRRNGLGLSEGDAAVRGKRPWIEDCGSANPSITAPLDNESLGAVVRN